MHHIVSLGIIDNPASIVGPLCCNYMMQFVA